MAARYWVGGTDTWDNTAGSKWALTSGGAGGQAVPTSADTVFFDAASGANTVTIGITAQASTLTMTGFTGTIAFGTNKIQLSATASGTVYNQPNTMSVTGTPLIELIGAGTTGIRTLSAVSVTQSNAVSVNVTAGSSSSSVICTTGSAFKDFNFTGFTGTYSGASSAVTLYGNLTLGVGLTCSSAGGATIFAATTGTQTITTNGISFGPITLNSTATLQLVDNLTILSTSNYAFSLTAGTLDLNNKTLTSNIFTSSNSNTRSILFGTSGNITLVGSGTSLFSMNTANNFSYTGTSLINISNASATASTIGFGTVGGTEANSLNFNITTGSYTLTVTSNSVIKNLIFTGYTGTWSPGTATYTFYGSLTLVSGMTFTTGTGAWTFAGTSGTQTIISAGKTLYSVSINGVGGTVQLGDALTLLNGLTLTNGVFNANNFNVSAGFVNSNNANVRTLTMGSGTWTLTGAFLSTGALWNFLGVINLTFNKNTANIVIANTSVLTFNNAPQFSGGGLTYNNLTISDTSNITDLLITGANTFNTISMAKTVPCALTFSFIGTHTIGTLAVSGSSSSSLVTIKTNSIGTTATLNITNSFILDYAVVKDIVLSSSNGTVTNGYVSPSSTGFTVGTGTNYFDIFYNTSSVYFTVPATWNSSSNSAYLIGGGGGSSGASVGTVTANRTAGAGGGGGGFAKVTNTSLTPSSTIYCVVGSGGTAGTGATASGTSTGGTGGTTGWNGTLSTTTYVSNALSQQTTAATTITVTVPSVSNGNLMLMALCSTTTPATWTTPTGWTLAGSGGPNALFWRIASSEPASYTVTSSVNAASSAYIVAYANATFNVISSIPASASGTSVTPSLVNLTYNISPGSTIVYIGATLAASTNFSTPSGYSVVATDSDANAASMAIFNKFNVTSTFSYAAPSTTISGGVNTGWAYVVVLSPAVTYAATATGGTGGVATGGTSSTGGTGGVGIGGILNYTGGSGGTGSTSTTTTATSAGGGGGSAGPAGNGGNGGNGLTSTTILSAGGGGGNGGGSAGGNGSTTLTGSGGNNSLGYGGGASQALTAATAGSSGSAGGGASGAGGGAGAGSYGGTGIDIIGLYGSGGGSSGSTSGTSVITASLAYGSAPGGGSTSTSTAAPNGAAGAPGVIILVWSSGNNNYTDSITENSSLDDIKSILMSLTSTITENSSLNDTSSVTADFTFNIVEANNLDDVISISFSSAASITENIYLDNSQIFNISYNLTLSEDITLQDFNSVLASFFQSLVQGLNIDDLSTQVSNFIISLTENGTITSVENVQANFNHNISENINLESLQESVYAFLASVTEAVTVDDLIQAGLIFIDSISENFAVESSGLAEESNIAFITEYINTTDLNSVKADYIVSMLENIGLLDTAITSGWIRINDDQSISWNNVNNASSTTWTEVNNDNLNPWDEINNSQ